MLPEVPTWIPLEIKDARSSRKFWHGAGSPTGNSPLDQATTPVGCSDVGSEVPTGNISLLPTWAFESAVPIRYWRCRLGKVGSKGVTGSSDMWSEVPV